MYRLIYYFHCARRLAVHINNLNSNNFLLPRPFNSGKLRQQFLRVATN